MTSLTWPSSAGKVRYTRRSPGRRNSASVRRRTASGPSSAPPDGTMRTYVCPPAALSMRTESPTTAACSVVALSDSRVSSRTSSSRPAPSSATWTTKPISTRVSSRLITSRDSVRVSRRPSARSTRSRAHPTGVPPMVVRYHSSGPGACARAAVANASTAVSAYPAARPVRVPTRRDPPPVRDDPTIAAARRSGKAPMSPLSVRVSGRALCRADSNPSVTGREREITRGPSAAAHHRTATATSEPSIPTPLARPPAACRRPRPEVKRASHRVTMCEYKCRSTMENLLTFEP